MDKLKQRELIGTVVGSLLVAFAPRLGLDLTTEQVYAIAGMIGAYAMSRGMAKTEEQKAP